MKNLLCNTETEIPEVDNTDIPCDIFYSSECVVMENLSATVKNYFNLGDTPTLTEYAEAVGLALKDAKERIITLENSGGGGGTPQPNPQVFRITTTPGGFLAPVEIYEDGVLTQTITNTDTDTDFLIDISKQIYIKSDQNNIMFIGNFEENEIGITYYNFGSINKRVLLNLTEGTYNLFRGSNTFVTIYTDSTPV